MQNEQNVWFAALFPTVTISDGFFSKNAQNESSILGKISLNRNIYLKNVVKSRIFIY